MAEDKMDQRKISKEEAQVDEEQADFSDTSSLGKGDILSLENTDPVLNAKMHIINNVSAAHLFYSNDYQCYPRHRAGGTLTRDHGRLLMRLAGLCGRSSCSA